MKDMAIWIPKYKYFVYMFDGDGSQLLPEDNEDAYIDYKISELDYNEFIEGDGGIFLYNSSDEPTKEQLIKGVLNEIFGDGVELPDYVELEM